MERRELGQHEGQTYQAFRGRHTPRRGQSLVARYTEGFRLRAFLHPSNGAVVWAFPFFILFVFLLPPPQGTVICNNLCTTREPPPPPTRGIPSGLSTGAWGWKIIPVSVAGRRKPWFWPYVSCGRMRESFCVINFARNWCQSRQKGSRKVHARFKANGRFWGCNGKASFNLR